MRKNNICKKISYHSGLFKHSLTSFSYCVERELFIFVPCFWTRLKKKGLVGSMCWEFLSAYGEKGKYIIDLCALLEDGGLSDCITSVKTHQVLCMHKGSTKNGIFKQYFLNWWTPLPPPPGTFRNWGFQGQKRWPPKFHIEFRNTTPPPFKEIFIKKNNLFAASLRQLLISRTPELLSEVS